MVQLQEHSPQEQTSSPSPTLPQYPNLQRQVQVRVIGVRDALAHQALHCKRKSNEHTLAQHLHPPPPQHSTGSCSIPPLRVWALGCEHQDSQPGKEERWQFHYVLGQQVLLDRWQCRFLCWWQRAGAPQPTVLSIATTGVTTHRYRTTDQLQLRIVYTRLAIFPKDFYCKALRETAAPRVTGPGPGSQHSPRDRR